MKDTVGARPVVLRDVKDAIIREAHSLPRKPCAIEYLVRRVPRCIPFIDRTQVEQQLQPRPDVVKALIGRPRMIARRTTTTFQRPKSDRFLPPVALALDLEPRGILACYAKRGGYYLSRLQIARRSRGSDSNHTG